MSINDSKLRKILKELTIERFSGLAEQRRENMDENNRRVMLENRARKDQQDQERLRKAGVLNELERIRNAAAVNKVRGALSQIKSVKAQNTRTKLAENLATILYSGDIILPKDIKAIKAEFEKLTRNPDYVKQFRKPLLDAGIKEAWNFAENRNPNIVDRDPMRELPEEGFNPVVPQRTKVEFARSILDPVDSLDASADADRGKGEAQLAPARSPVRSPAPIRRRRKVDEAQSQPVPDELNQTEGSGAPKSGKWNRTLQSKALRLAGQLMRRDPDLSRGEAMKMGFQMARKGDPSNKQGSGIMENAGRLLFDGLIGAPLRRVIGDKALRTIAPKSHKRINETERRSGKLGQTSQNQQIQADLYRRRRGF